MGRDLICGTRKRKSLLKISSLVDTIAPILSADILSGLRLPILARHAELRKGKSPSGARLSGLAFPTGGRAGCTKKIA